MSHYATLFELHIEHGFFPANEPLPFYSKLAYASQPVAAQYGLLIKPQPYGVSILADTHSAALALADDGIRLQLLFFMQDAQFSGYTAHTPGSGGYYFYCSLSAPLSQAVRLTAHDGIAARVERQQRRPDWVVDIRLAPTFIAAFIAQAALAPGAQTARWPQAPCIVPLMAACRRWKYLLTAPYVTPQCHIRDETGTEIFDYQGTEILLNGQLAQVFISQQPLWIQKKSPYRFQLHQDGKVLRQTLPLAMPLHLCRMKINHQYEILAEIIVND